MGDLNTLWYIRIMEYYSAINKNKLQIHTTWMNLKGFILSGKANPKRLYTM